MNIGGKGVPVDGHGQRRVLSPRRDPEHLEALMRRVVHAYHDLGAVRHRRDAASAARVATARHHLQLAIDVARDAGVGWTQIGDAVGITRGNAYQQFRRPALTAPRP